MMHACDKCEECKNGNVPEECLKPLTRFDLCEEQRKKDEYYDNLIDEWKNKRIMDELKEEFMESWLVKKIMIPILDFLEKILERMGL